jgi:gliding motility-associated lipoprotein GldH
MKTSLKASALLVLFAVAFSACESHVYSEYQGANMEVVPWPSDKAFTFKFKIPEDGKYHVKLGMRHHARIGFEAIKTSIKFTKPDGSTTTKKAQMLLKDPMNGEYMGEASGDVVDVEEIIFPDLDMVTGDYKIEVSQEMSEDDKALNGIFGVSVIVDKVEKE